MHPTTAERPERQFPKVACVILALREADNLRLMQHLWRRDPDIPLVALAVQQAAATIGAIRNGAYDYITTPPVRERVLVAVHRAVERRHLLREVRRLEAALAECGPQEGILGKSRHMRELGRQVTRVAGDNMPVCLVGEAGTGKSLVARAIHRAGSRHDAPFVTINYASVSRGLQQTELFGQESDEGGPPYRGALEQAEGGSLFLQDIDEMSEPTQLRLLEALRQSTIRRVNGSTDIPIDVSIICSTRRDLWAEVEARRFNEDLYAQLIVYPIVLPCLRDHAEDIPLLVGHFLRVLRAEVGRDVRRITGEALEALKRHDWPGNVRQLKDVLYAAMLAARSDEVSLADLPANIRVHVRTEGGVRSVEKADEREIVPLGLIERRAIERALKATEGSVRRASELLGISRATLYRRMQELQLVQGSGVRPATRPGERESTRRSRAS